MRSVTAFVAVLAMFAASAQDDVLVVEQDYNIVSGGKGGIEAKDVRQRLYITPDFICIDEFSGKDDPEKPTESTVVDLKSETIVDLFHDTKKKVTETFDARRKRLEKVRRQHEEDIADQPVGPQRDRLEKLFRALLDDKRVYSLADDEKLTKTVSGIACKGLKITADTPSGYVPFAAALHSDVELPYDNAEVLYLLQIIGKNMSVFVREHKAVFKYIPMELHLELPVGGKLDTHVVSVTKIARASIDTKRGGIGSPFDLPEYEEKRKGFARPAPPAGEFPGKAESPKTVKPD